MTRSLAVRGLVVAITTSTVLGVNPAPAPAHTTNSVDARRTHVVRRAMRQRGTRYVGGGARPRSGFDCSGFTRWVFGGHGAQLPHRSAMQYGLARQGGYKRIYKRTGLVRGDLVFFKTTSAKVGHVGIYIGRGRFVHASSGAGRVTVSSIWDRFYYGPRFRGATRVPKLR
jgi:cell wall-associated NlpC family hydrolase